MGEVARVVVADRVVEVELADLLECLVQRAQWRSEIDGGVWAASVDRDADERGAVRLSRYRLTSAAAAARAAAWSSRFRLLSNES
ncbi:hypothetical protein [Dietzia sp. ANT_WB102]|uniref:hypothetical protein n=1 Tax=Dietzia sp. ANT_WB102 TaxID=2597345 RepID=UPI0021071871|nr:hypothetical protein [Dietzia sp. ANT_WB102]